MSLSLRSARRRRAIDRKVVAARLLINQGVPPLVAYERAGIGRTTYYLRLKRAMTCEHVGRIKGQAQAAQEGRGISAGPVAHGQRGPQAMAS